MNGIILLPLVPMRASDSECSEMISQLLYGELVEILEVRERWLYVKNIADEYTGWVDRKMIKTIADKEFEQFSGVKPKPLYYPLVECDNNDYTEKMYLPGGSKLYSDNEIATLDSSKSLSFDPICQIYVNDMTGSEIIKVAKAYLNAPYLWGGKSILGMDCSGLVQVVFSICGIQLPRDASQQVEKGEVISFLEEAQAGDLAFFENVDGKIIHVGIMINSTQIIHASGWVKIENIDMHGIISSQTGEYTHRLRVIKRLINNI